MVQTDQLAEAALAGDALYLRALVQDWLRENPDLARCAPPRSSDATIRAVAAGLVELLAQRRHSSPPSWTHAVGAAPLPIFLVRAATTMKYMRRLCETESPEPLRRRNLLAPPTFLEFA